MHPPQGFALKMYQRDMARSRFHAPGPFPPVVVLDHVSPYPDVPQVLRTANALGCREVHLVGIPRFDPVPGAGALRHTRTRDFADMHSSLDALEREEYSVYLLQPRGTRVLGVEELPRNSAFVVSGAEHAMDLPARFPVLRTLRVPEFGVEENLDANAVVSLTLFQWLRQHVPLENAPVRVMTSRNQRNPTVPA